MSIAKKFVLPVPFVTLVALVFLVLIVLVTKYIGTRSDENYTKSIESIAHYEPGGLIRSDTGRYGRVYRKNKDGSAMVAELVTYRLTAPAAVYIPKDDPNYEDALQIFLELQQP